MASIKSVSFEGANNYVGEYWGTAVDFDEDPSDAVSKAASANPLARVFGALKGKPNDAVKDTSGNKQRKTISVKVPAGSAFFGAGTDNEGNFPANMEVKVTDPSGNRLTASSANNPDQLVSVDANGNVMRFAVRSAMAGIWTIQVTVPDSVEDLHYFTSTLPTADIENTLLSVLGGLLSEQNSQRLAQSSSGSSIGCVLCQAGLWAVAIVVSAIEVAALVLDPEVIPIEVELIDDALSAVSDIPAAQKSINSIITTLKVLYSQEGLRAVPDTVASVCMWLGACTPSVQLNSFAPPTSVTGSVTLTATATNAVKVAFLVDGAVIGTAAPASAGSNQFSIAWDSTKSPSGGSLTNGSHVLAAVAIGDSRRSSLPMSVTSSVQNSAAAS